MPFKTFVDSVSLPSTDLNTYLMKQTVIVCTSGTRPSSPIEGMTIYETDTDRLLVYTTATTGWQPPWNMPWGALGFAQVTTTQGSITTVETDLTSLAVTVSVPANRRLKVTGDTAVVSTVSGDYADLRIKETTTQLNRCSMPLAVAGFGTTCHAEAIIAGPSSGSHTYKLALQRTVGTGSLTSSPSATDPAYIHVEDIGPNGAPA